MILQLIRNATLRLTYADETILIDPDLAAPFTRPSFTGRSANPMVALPLPIATITQSLSMILVSHLHRDHFDAVELLPASLPLLCQPGDEERIAARGFERVIPVAETLRWNRIQITRVGGQHGAGAVGQLMGAVSGFVLAAAGEPTLYWAGDTIDGPDVADTIARFQPAVIVTHSCGATWPDETGARQLIVMDAAQTIAVCRAAATSTIIATHMESLDHATVSRAALRAAADAAGIDPAQLLIPADGETITYGSGPGR
jgi:L-ascorbate metabolism protein UlaG (beta-lactamase superfamily)